MSDPVAAILDRLEAVKQTSAGQWLARCPAHDDRHPSLSVGRGDDGRVLLDCKAGCSAMDVCQALGLPLRALFPPAGPADEPRGEIVATYNYVDAKGCLLFQTVRFRPKDFRQRRPDGDSGWVWNLDGTPRVLYRLPELISASPNDWVSVVEGEKDADSLAALGLVATTCPMGAGKWHKLSDDSVLYGRRVAIVPDADDAGRNHADTIARALHSQAAELRIVQLPGDGKDASDWIEAGGTAEQLIELVEASEPYVSSAESSRDGSDNCDLVQLGTRDPTTGRLVLSPRRTLPTAEAFVAEHHTRHGMRTLHSYAGLMLTWRDNRYAELEDQAIRHQLQPWLHQALRYLVDRRTGRAELVDFECNPTTVNAAMDSIRTLVHLSATVTPQDWLGTDEDRPAPHEILPCRSLSLYIPTGRVTPATPALFTTNALDFDYDPDAPEPEIWLSFLDELWGDDSQSIELLQEWFGYCLTADTSQHKMLLLVGPKRSGKGTIGRVLRRLIGPDNVAGPTTRSLAGPFGLQPLIGKSLAIVSDARFGGQDVATVAERLLCISGEDALTVDRKHLPSVTMRLPTRFMFLANELPRIRDVSGALAGRFLVLQLEKSFFGREDPTLTDRLLTELPGILLWALQGWLALHRRGRFVQPDSALSALRDLEDLASPVGAFVRECCQVGPGRRAWVEDLYEAWKKWCQADGRLSVTTRQRFGRDLLAAVPGLKCRRNSEVGRFYDGISLE